MPSGATTTVRNGLAAHMFGGAALSQPTTWWIELLYGTITDVGSHGTASSWGRKQCTQWNITNNVAANTNAITWTADLVTTPRTITGYAIYSASSSGTEYYWGSLTTPVDVTAGNVVEIAAGAISVTLT